MDATPTTIFGRVVYSHRLRGLFLSALKVELVTYDAFKNWQRCIESSYTFLYYHKHKN